jgi:hypothetical protein
MRPSHPRRAGARIYSSMRCQTRFRILRGADLRMQRSAMIDTVLQLKIDIGLTDADESRPIDVPHVFIRVSYVEKTS